MTAAPSISPALRSFEVHSTPVLLAGLLIVLTAAVLATGSPILSRFGMGMLINIVLVVGLFVFIGNSGILCFGQLGFVAVGAYMTAWLTMKPAIKKMVLTGLPPLLQNAQAGPVAAAVCAGLAAAIVALATGAVIMRLSGIAAAIATLAFLAIVNTLLANADPVTGGTGSLAGISTDLTLWTVLVWAIVSIVIAHWHGCSAAGLQLKAVREDGPAAKACGISGYRTRLIAYVISAFVCGIAGNLQARFLGVISPDSFYITATFVALTMLTVGGVATLSGAVVGVLVVGTILEVLVRLEGEHTLAGVSFTLPSGMAELVAAVTMCFVLVTRPQGLVGAGELTLPMWRRTRLARHPSPEMP
jgi:branched-chain amino acid transport system permease protein